MRRSKYALMGSVAICAIALSAPALAQAPAAQPSSVEEVVVTGSRVIRDGTASATPVDVVGVETMQKQAGGNVSTLLSTLPVFSSSVSPNSGNTNAAPSAGLPGLNLVNLRGLGVNRSLVLLDGQRFVPVLTFGSVSNSAVDVSAIPQQLIQRIETVTGGASAVYGSDAVGGVVNFILDKRFTGLKGDVSAGVTGYGDDENAKLSLTYGTPFADDRGHFLLSGELYHKEQLIDSSNRKWNLGSQCVMVNPAFTTTNGLPFRITASECGETSAPGGVINTGPLRGTTFGPGGVPLPFQYGALISSPIMSGGSWRLTADEHLKRGSSLDPGEKRQNVFAFLSYDLSESLKLSYSASWSHTDSETQHLIAFFDTPGVTIRSDNGFIPASLRPALVGTPSFVLSTLNADIPPISSSHSRYVIRHSLALDGSLNLFETDWHWNAYYQYGKSRNSLNTYSISRSRYANAVDAIATSNGTLACRINTDAVSSNDDPACVPFNLFGIGVNSPAAVAYVSGVGHVTQSNSQEVYAASITGEPFSLWAGPIGIALSAEHRKEIAKGGSNPGALANDMFSGNFKPVNGSFSVTEVAFEAAVPLARDLPLIKAWDMQLAARATDYSSSGSVQTWKVGSTFSPIEDIKFRGNISRDIRAGNLGELFAFAGAPLPSPGTVDLFTNTTSAPVISSRGNAELRPEEADSWGLGVVAQPSFLPGFSASVDYWHVEIDGAITALNGSQAIQLCFSGNSQACSFITRSGPATIPGASGTPYAGQSFAPITAIATSYVNIASTRVRGLDGFASYTFPLSSISPFDGQIALRWDHTYYFRGFSHPGTPGSVPSYTAPYWRATASATYTNAPWSMGLTGRYTSKDALVATLLPQIVECRSGCPQLSTLPPNYWTQDSVIREASLYFDAHVTRDVTIGNTSAQVYFNVRNLFNRDPVPTMSFSSIYGVNQSTVGDDALGRIFRVGVRFKM